MTIRMIWNPATGQGFLTVKDHNGWIRSIGWSPDRSRFASGSDDKTVRIWDLATG